MSEQAPKAFEDQLAAEAERAKTEDRLGQRYDELFAEREELFEQLSKYESRIYDVVFSPENRDKESIKTLRDNWIARVEAETDLLLPLERLGIEIFSDDLTLQPGFPDAKIDFGSKEILRQNVVDQRLIAGQASRRENLIEIGEPQPSLARQLWTYLSKGQLMDSVETLIHELVHRRHLEENPQTSAIYTEAQAFFSGLYSRSSGFGIGRSFQALTKSSTENGLYEFHEKPTYEALLAVTGLYGLGVGDDKIADLIAKSDVGVDSRFQPLASELDRLKREQGLNELDQDALYDIFRLHVANQRRRAQLLLYQEIDHLYTRQELTEMKIGAARKSIGVPDYELDGVRVPADKLLQFVILPANEEYPYDPEGLRSGVIFGYFQQPDAPDEASKKEAKFGIGRWEARGKKGAVKLASSADEEEKFLSEITRASTLTAGTRLFVLERYAYESRAGLDDPFARRVLKALFQHADSAKATASLIAEHNKGPLGMVLEELEFLLRLVEKHPLPQETDVKIKSFSQVIELYDFLQREIGLPILEADGDFTKQVAKVREMLGALKKKLPGGAADESKS